MIVDRRVGDLVAIGDSITVRVHAIAGGRVKLDVRAPAGVRIDRGEIRDKIDRERGQVAPGGNGGEP